MLHNPSSIDIGREWTVDIAAHLEAGLTPVLDLGYSHSVLDGVPAAVALQSLINRRRDVAFPVAVAGGSSQLWLAALMHDAERGGGLSRGPRTIFAGADMGTYMASLSLATEPPLRAADLVLPQPAEVPDNLRWHFALSTRPGQTKLWETLPIHIMEGDSGEMSHSKSGDEESVWQLVASLLTVTALILFALIA